MALDTLDTCRMPTWHLTHADTWHLTHDMAHDMALDTCRMPHVCIVSYQTLTFENLCAGADSDGSVGHTLSLQSARLCRKGDRRA